MAEIANIGARSPAEREEAAANAVRRVLPALDIWEDEGAVTVVADMPGVGTEELEVELADHTLTLGGHIGIDLPETLAARFAELRASRYERQLALGEGIDTDRIEASAKDGVVTVRLPKTSSTRRRRIEVHTS